MSRCLWTHLVDLSECAVAQLAHNFPDVVGIDAPLDVLILLDFLLYVNSGQTQYFAESSECHYFQYNNTQLKNDTIKRLGSLTRGSLRTQRRTTSQKQHLSTNSQSSLSASWRTKKKKESCDIWKNLFYSVHVNLLLWRLCGENES